MDRTKAVALNNKAIEIIESVKPLLVKHAGTEPRFFNLVITDRLSRCHGKAIVKKPHSANPTYEIRLNYNAYADHPDSEAFRTVVIHEYCHLYGYWGSLQLDHGKYWKELMVVCGLDPNRLVTEEDKLEINYDFTPKRVERKFIHFCECRNHFLTPHKHARIMRGYGYRCVHCDTRLSKNFTEA